MQYAARTLRLLDRGHVRQRLHANRRFLRELRVMLEFELHAPDWVGGTIPWREVAYHPALYRRRSRPEATR